MASLPIEAGATLLRQMAAGQVDAYRLDLPPAGAPLLVTVEQLGIDVAVAAFAPDGRRIALVDSPLDRQGIESLLLAAPAGRYRIEVQAREPGAPPAGRYRIRIETLAPPSAASAADPAGAAVAAARAAARTDAEAAMTAAGERYAAATPAARREALGLYARAQELFGRAGDAAGEVRAMYERAVASRLVDEPGAAIELARAALPRWEALGEGALAAAAENEIGLDSWLLGRGDEARAAFESALGRSRACGDRYGEAVAASNRCLMDLNRGELRAGIACYDGAVPLLEAVGADELLAGALTSAGRAYDAIGEPLAARSRYLGALARLRSTANRESEARVRNNLGVLDAGLGEIAEALAQYGQALAIFRDLADRRWQARVLNNIGLVYQATGEPGRARASFEPALALWQAVGDRAGEMTTQTNLGAIDALQGDPRQAAAHLARALDLARALKDRRGEGIALTQLGRAQLDLGDAAAAGASFTQAADRLAALGDLANHAEALRGQGEASAAQGDATGALTHLNAALAAFRKSGTQAGVARVLYLLARTEDRFGAPSGTRAAAAPATAVSGASATGEVPSDAPAAGAGGGAAERMHDLALEHAAQALDAFEALRPRIGDPDLGTSFAAVAHQAYELDIDLLMAAHRAAPAAGHDREALAVSERARARTLLDALAAAGVAVPAGAAPQLVARRTELAERLAAKAELAARQPAASAAERAAREAEQQDILRELDLAEAELRERNPAWSALVHPRPLDAGGILALLDGDTLLLSYSLGETHSYLWVVAAGSGGGGAAGSATGAGSDLGAVAGAVTSYELPPRALIEHLARTLHQEWSVAADPAAGRPAAAATARKLSDILLGPVAGQLGERRLAIVPDGALDYIPFAALPEPGTQAGGAAIAVPLVERHQVVVLPSASALAIERRQLAARQPPAHLLAVFADPVFAPDDPRVAAASRRSPEDPAARSAPSSAPQPSTPSGTPSLSAAAPASVPDFVRLPASRQEAQAIAALVPPAEAVVALDFAASRAAVLGDRLAGYRVVHFATHGVLDSDHPALSGLALSLVDARGRPQQGFVDLRDIYGLRLAADLVVLSGCRTALGREARGEGLVSLARGFQYAGAARVLATLWRIDDRAAAALMTRFYRRLLGLGLPPAAALRAAQRELRQDRRYRDPFYWAAYVLVGDWR